jgi:cytoskeletal protein RodZ
MKTIFPMVTTILLAGGLMAANLSAQSLADVARREQAREKTIKVHGRTYTNADLPRSRREAEDASTSSSTAAPASAEASETASGQPDAKASEPSANNASTDEGADAKSPVHDREYWHKRMATAQATRDQAQVLIEAMQSRINALTADFAARDDPRQRAQIADQREKALAELDRLKKALDAATKGIADLEEEARRAGVPPGWLRG